MPSRLLNRVHTVQWSDFLAPPPHNAAEDAHIETKANLSYQYSNGSNGAKLSDTVTVTIQLLGQQSWAKKQRINGWSPQARTDLLKHEQGHYDITALMARDMFIDLMALKSRTFPTVGALQNEVKAVAERYAPQAIHTKYDSVQETDHSRNVTPQLAWNGYIQTAFTQRRTPLVLAPDGAPYKVRLLDVLRNAGKI